MVWEVRFVGTPWGSLSGVEYSGGINQKIGVRSFPGHVILELGCLLDGIAVSVRYTTKLAGFVWESDIFYAC